MQRCAMLPCSPVLWCATVRCRVLFRAVVRCGTLWCVVVRCGRAKKSPLNPTVKFLLKGLLENEERGKMGGNGGKWGNSVIQCP